MKRLRDYSHSSGWVLDANKVPDGSLLSYLYFGVSEDATPTSSTFDDLTVVEDVVVEQTFNFPDGDGKYLYFAIPKYVQENTLITILNFSVNFLKYDVTITVDGVPIVYEVNRSEYVQNGTGIVGQIVVQ